jgi:O-methyltransferase involved in polyketide biosynthesis
VPWASARDTACEEELDNPVTQEPTAPKSLAEIGATALGVALLRARESSRPDRLFDDSYARHFLQAVAPASTPWAAGPSPATARVL